ncbi:MAG: hypothetical protein JXA49_02285 [Actinobacteria bacterium]|nr:hypothetical protein [Actinomycetota bacterium]
MSEKQEYGVESRGGLMMSVRKLFQSSPVLGYIGAQTGNLIIQAVIAAAVGIAVGVRVYWSRISAFFSKNKGKSESADISGEVKNEEELSPLEESLLPESGTDGAEGPCSVTSTNETGIED